MLNKILTKKIKFPLSLRGERQRSNPKGFSLIELMVAVTILAIAILGIFQAYSVGFMGMADARDRTVATNYLQEMIEDFKNMDFNQVKSEPITLIPDTKFSRGAYILNLEEIDGVVTLKKVITQVRWMDRKGNIKTEKASTILYNKPDTSVVSGAARIIIYAQPYYTILPSDVERLDIFAEIKDENGNTVYGGPITFSIITKYDENDVNDKPVGYIYEEGRNKNNPVDTGDELAPDGIAHVIFKPFSSFGEAIDIIERIEASADLDGDGTKEATDTVNIRVTTGPVGIILKPETEEDRIRPAGEGETATIKLNVVKSDYDTYIEYDSPITLSAIGPGTLSTNTISIVDTNGILFNLISNGTPGVVEVTASAPDLDMGYTEITFTGDPTSILVEAEKNSVYPGEDITVTVTIVDENNVSVGYDRDVSLNANPDHGNFSPNPLSFEDGGALYLESTFKINIDATVGDTVTLQANSEGLSGSTEITILSLLTPYYLDLFAYPFSVDINGEEIFTSITATIYDNSGTEVVTTYKTPITFFAKDKYGNDFDGIFFPNDVIPSEGEVTVIFSSDGNSTGTVTITASSGDLTLDPAGGVDVVFYSSATQIVLSANPPSIEAGGLETSKIKATIYDSGENKVVNYTEPITFSTNLGKFSNNQIVIEINDWDEGEAIVELSSSNDPGTATITASSGSLDLTPAEGIYVEFTGEIPTELTLGDVVNWDDYNISFVVTIAGSPLYLNKMVIEWDNDIATLDQVTITIGDEGPTIEITPDLHYSPCTIEGIEEVLVVGESNIMLIFSGSKMKRKNITVTFTDKDDPSNEYEVSFQVPD